MLDAGPGKALEQALADALGDPGVSILGSTQVRGGCINHAARLDTTAGPVFAKWHDTPPAGMFSAEAEGLAALRKSGTPLVIPEPIAWNDGGKGKPGFLLATWLERGRPGPRFDERLGEGLATLHRATAEAFGFAHDGFCGSTPQPNGPLPSWVGFYRERRLGFQVRLARDTGRMSRDESPIYDTVLARLADLLPDDGEDPALIHGDLWSGNLWVASDGTPGLVDPATYYAHREAELGMMTLMGGFRQRVYEAYDATWPLPHGWRERNGLYQLYHLLNHLNLFGGGYGAQALAVARRYA